MCIFPFQQSSWSGTGWRNDCAYGNWGEFFCPVIVDEDTSESVGFPFEAGCPDKEPWEKKPTCFESNPEDNDKLGCHEIQALGNATGSSSKNIEHSWEFWDPSLVLDGVISYKIGHVFLSEIEIHPWLQVAFEDEVEIVKIIVAMRQDCCHDLFQDVKVAIGDEPAEIGQITANEECDFFEGPHKFADDVHFNCKRPLRGHYVVIQRTSDLLDYFNFDDVTICGATESNNTLH